MGFSLSNLFSFYNRGRKVGKTLAYSINHEKHLCVFLTDGRIPSDNNYTEQAIRPFTIGRKLCSLGIQQWRKSQCHAGAVLMNTFRSYRFNYSITISKDKIIFFIILILPDTF
ncbi:MAG: transposase [Ruminococcus sp.]|nr:transposase [Ruminococcus sp.]